MFTDTPDATAAMHGLHAAANAIRALFVTDRATARGGGVG